MGIRAVGLAVIFGAAVTSCASTTSTTTPATSPSATRTGAATAHKARIPAGYKRAGGAAQGISIALPASWVSINLAHETIESVASRFHLSGISARMLIRDIETLQDRHAIVVFDIKSAIAGPGHFARNLKAWCDDSGIDAAGTPSIPALRTTMTTELRQLGATHLIQKELKVGGVPALETSYQANTPTTGRIYVSQFEAVPKASKACVVTLTTGRGEASGQTLQVAEATAEFP